MKKFRVYKWSFERDVSEDTTQDKVFKPTLSVIFTSNNQANILQPFNLITPCLFITTLQRSHTGCVTTIIVTWCWWGKNSDNKENITYIVFLHL